MDLRWLSAPEADVKAAVQDIAREPGPPPVRNGRRVVAHLNTWLMLCYLGVVWLMIGSQAGVRPGGLERDHVLAIVVVMVVFVAWAWGTLQVYTWACRPSRASRISADRLALTAQANGFEAEPVRRALFSALITGERRTASCYPRFVAPGIEFGNLRARGHNTLEWHYVAVKLPVPQPHLVFDAADDGSLPSELPRLDPGQQILLGGGFDRTFRLYAPRAYATDALFLLTPDVMAILMDHAWRYNIEIIDDHLIFFRSAPADFSDPAAWEAVNVLRRNAVPGLMSRADRYRDQDVLHDGDGADEPTARRRAAYLAVIEEMGFHWLRPAPSIGALGRRLQMRQRRITWPLVRTRLWYVLVFVLYVTPVSVAFGGFMSVISGH